MQEKRCLVFVWEQTFSNVTWRTVASMPAGSTVAKNQKVKSGVLPAVHAWLLDHQPCLVNLACADRRMLPANTLCHARDLALDRRVAGEIQGLRRIGAMTFSASGITDTVM